MNITLEADFGCYLLVADDGRDRLIQDDRDWPGLASSFGWQPCHRETDGTIDCPVCGRLCEDMIEDANEFLNKHVGDSIEDPGYFEQEN